MYECPKCKEIGTIMESYDGKYYYYNCASCGYSEKSKKPKI